MLSDLRILLAKFDYLYGVFVNITLYGLFFSLHSFTADQFLMNRYFLLNAISARRFFLVQIPSSCKIFLQGNLKEILLLGRFQPTSTGKKKTLIMVVDGEEDIM